VAVRHHTHALRIHLRELRASSPEFARWWTRPNPQGRTSGMKRFRHPQAGDLTIEWEAFAVPDDSTQTLFIYSPHDAGSAEALRLLASWRATLLRDRDDVVPGAPVPGQLAAPATSSAVTAPEASDASERQQIS
ncbi:hypothetical protein ILP97_63025, partial [Amycolatopsis sp. H6(2020)]|nr:hypothetical protein [Amycolatopsis sp. H6(2020)]